MLIVGVLLAAVVLFAAVGVLSGTGANAAAEFYGLVMPAAGANTLVLIGAILALASVLAGKLISTAVARRRVRRAGAPDEPDRPGAASIINATDDPTGDVSTAPGDAAAKTAGEAPTGTVGARQPG